MFLELSSSLNRLSWNKPQLCASVSAPMDSFYAHTERNIEGSGYA